MKRLKKGLSVPDDLAVSPRWVRRFGKRPVTVEGESASVTNPATWAPLESAVSSEIGSGLGFVLGNGIGCIDFDDVIDAKGRLAQPVEWLLRDLPTTWVEVSPSGRGLHVWGFLPEGRGRKFRYEGVSVEVYSRDRYITVVGGDSFRGAPTRLADLSEFIGMHLS